MASSTMTYSNTTAFHTPTAKRSVNSVKTRPAFSATEFFVLLQQSFAMARSISDVGRVSTKDVERIRAIFDAK